MSRLIRLYSPVAIRFDEAILLAVVGLGVNLLSAWLLFERDHPHEHHHDHGEYHHHEDTNIRAAYSHVVADALTSVLAIVALLGGRFMGWVWLDPVIGVVGAIIIARWSWGLIRDAGAVLLDTVPDERLAKTIREKLEQDGDRVADLHLWRVGPGHSALIAAIVADHPQSPRVYKERLASLGSLSHITIEVHPCPERAPVARS